MGENLTSNHHKIITKIFSQYKIKLISTLNSIDILIQKNSNLYQSHFNFEDLKKLFIDKNLINSFLEFISSLIEHNNIKIEENKNNLKLILLTTLINSPKIE